MELSPEKIAKFREIYANSTSELAKKTAKEKLEEAGVSLTEAKKAAEPISLSQEKIDKFRYIYANSTSDLAKKTAKEKLEEAGVPLSEKKTEPKAPKEVKEPKAKAPKEPKEPKAPKAPKEGGRKIDEYDCDELVAKVKERKAKAKIAAAKRAAAPKKSPATKNKETVVKTAAKVEKSIVVRAKKGAVNTSEIEKLIKEYEDAIKKLKALLTKIKSGKKFAKGGAVDEVDAESANEFHEIKEHSCACGDGKYAKGGEVGNNASWEITFRDKNDFEEFKHTVTGDFEDEEEAVDKAIKENNYFIDNDNNGRIYKNGSEIEAINAKKKMAKGGALNSKSIRNKKVWISEQGRRPNFHTTAILTQKTFEETKKQFNDDSKWEIERTDEDMYTWVRKEDGYVFALRLMEIFEDGGLVSDKKFRALKAGERTSHKYANVEMRGGGVYQRRNANQFGKVKGGNEYSEGRENRSDRKQYLEHGGEVGNKVLGAEIKKKIDELDSYSDEKLAKMYSKLFNVDYNDCLIELKDNEGEKEAIVNAIMIKQIFYKKSTFAKGGEVSNIFTGELRQTILLGIGDSFLLNSVRSPKDLRFIKVELVVEKIKDNKIIESFVRKTGEKVPFVIDLYGFKIENYAKGGEIKKKSFEKGGIIDNSLIGKKIFLLKDILLVQENEEYPTYKNAKTELIIKRIDEPYIFAKNNKENEKTYLIGFNEFKNLIERKLVEIK